MGTSKSDYDNFDAADEAMLSAMCIREITQEQREKIEIRGDEPAEYQFSLTVLWAFSYS